MAPLSSSKSSRSHEEDSNKLLVTLHQFAACITSRTQKMGVISRFIENPELFVTKLLAVLNKRRTFNRSTGVLAPRGG